jgi:hypothetical protein
LLSLLIFFPSTGKPVLSGVEGIKMGMTLRSNTDHPFSSSPQSSESSGRGPEEAGEKRIEKDEVSPA